MPSPSDNARITRKFDKRVSLTEEDKVEIKQLYLEGSGIREIARRFEEKCSRRLIHFVLFPERLVNAKKNYDWKKYYTTEKHKLDMRKHRAYKRGLLETGQIEPGSEIK